MQKVSKGKIIYRDQESNLSVGVFENTNKRKTKYGIVSFCCLRGVYKKTFEVSLPEFQRLITLINRMPEIEVVKKEKKKRKIE